VVDDQGAQPGVSSILRRSLSRLVPFDAFSFLGNYARGWHDKWSNTWVIDEKKQAFIAPEVTKSEVTSD